MPGSQNAIIESLALKETNRIGRTDSILSPLTHSYIRKIKLLMDLHAGQEQLCFLKNENVQAIRSVESVVVRTVRRIGNREAACRFAARIWQEKAVNRRDQPRKKARRSGRRMHLTIFSRGKNSGSGNGGQSLMDQVDIKHVAVFVAPASVGRNGDGVWGRRRLFLRNESGKILRPVRGVWTPPLAATKSR